jgi:hypothetical protein
MERHVRVAQLINGCDPSVLLFIKFGLGRRLDIAVKKGSSSSRVGKALHS